MANTFLQMIYQDSRDSLKKFFFYAANPDTFHNWLTVIMG